MRLPPPPKNTKTNQALATPPSWAVDRPGAPRGKTTPHLPDSKAASAARPPPTRGACFSPPIALRKGGGKGGRSCLGQDRKKCLPFAPTPGLLRRARSPSHQPPLPLHTVARTPSAATGEGNRMLGAHDFFGPPPRTRAGHTPRARRSRFYLFCFLLHSPLLARPLPPRLPPPQPRHTHSLPPCPSTPSSAAPTP